MESCTAGDELMRGLDPAALGMTSPEDWMGAEWFRYFSGSALNLSAQRAQQKKKCLPACQLECFVALAAPINSRSEEHTSELQSHLNLVCRLLLEKKKKHLNE